MQTPTQAPVSPEVQALLAQLEPVIAPPAVSWWPLAPGWWVVMFAALTLVAAGIYWLILRHKRQAYRREALRQLLVLTPESTNNFAAQVNALLKRTALTTYPEARAVISKSSGQPWLQFLNGTGPKPVFPSSLDRVFTVSGYERTPNFDANQLKACALKWIKTHKHSIETPGEPCHV